MNGFDLELGEFDNGVVFSSLLPDTAVVQIATCFVEVLATLMSEALFKNGSAVVFEK